MNATATGSHQLNCNCRVYSAYVEQARPLLEKGIFHNEGGEDDGDDGHQFDENI